MTGELPSPLHGICWLKRDQGTVVATGRAEDADILEPLDLPEGCWELHWCGSAAAAAAFVLGVTAVGRNSITASQGCYGAEGIVLLNRADVFSPGKTLEDAVGLYLHDNVSDQKAHVRWKAVKASLRTMYKSESQTVKPVRMSAVSEHGIYLGVSYPHWNGTLESGRRGGSNSLRIVDKAGNDYLVLSLDRYPQCRAAGETFIGQLVEAASVGGWRYEGEVFAMPIDDAGIAAMLDRLGDVFHSMWMVEWEAELANRNAATMADKTNRRIVNAITNGGTLTSNRKYVLTHPNGRTEIISGNRISNMERAGMIEEHDGMYAVTTKQTDSVAIPAPAP